MVLNYPHRLLGNCEKKKVLLKKKQWVVTTLNKWTNTVKLVTEKPDFTSDATDYDTIWRT